MIGSSPSITLEDIILWDKRLYNLLLDTVYILYIHPIYILDNILDKI